MRKKLAAIMLLTGIAVATLSGCAAAEDVAASDGQPVSGGAPTPSEENGTYSQPTRYGYNFSAQEFTYKLKDGREVTCIWAGDSRSGGPSCDWENIKPSDR